MQLCKRAGGEGEILRKEITRAQFLVNTSQSQGEEETTVRLSGGEAGGYWKIH